MDRLNGKKEKKRKKCPAQEVNPEDFIKPIKVAFQSLLFPLVSKIKKMPPIKRRWNYSTATWDFLGDQGMKPKPSAKPVGIMPNNKDRGDIKATQIMPGEKVRKLYNCIHCNRCRTSEARIKLKRRMFDRGQVPNDFEGLFQSYEKFDTPLNQDTKRIRKFNEIPTHSSTLLFLGCFSSIKSPELAEHAIEYLLKQKVDFTILEKEICCGLSLKSSGEKRLYDELKEKNLKVFQEKGFKEIICICPACYNMFRKNYKNSGIQIRFITEFLTPLKSNNALKSVNIQHSCHLRYEGKKKLVKNVEKVLVKSGFQVNKTPHWCCGGGMGSIYINKTIEKIGRLRAHDFTEHIVTTYCPSCYWMLKVYGRKEKQPYELLDIYQLLMQ